MAHFSFGESEYSVEAETAYAEFIASGSHSEEAFAALCAAHPELADELEGLHADFASIAGVLQRAGLLRGTPAREPLHAPMPEIPEQPPSPLDLEREAHPSQRGSGGRREAVASARPTEGSAGDGQGRRVHLAWSILLAVVLGTALAWSFVEGRGAAQEHERLRSELAQLEERARASAESRELASSQAQAAEARAAEAEERAASARYSAALSIAAAHLDRERFHAAQAALERCPEEARHWEWSHLALRARNGRAAKAQRALLEAAFDPLGEGRLARALSAVSDKAVTERSPPAVVSLTLEELPTDMRGALASGRAQVDMADGRSAEAGKALRVRDARSGDPLVDLPLPAPVSALAWDAKGSRLLLRFENGRVEAWSGRTH